MLATARQPATDQLGVEPRATGQPGLLGPVVLVERGEGVLELAVHAVEDRDVLGHGQLLEPLQQGDGLLRGAHAPVFFAGAFFAAAFFAGAFGAAALAAGAFGPDSCASRAFTLALSASTSS